MHNSDILQRFLFENSNVRGMFIHLDNSYRTVLNRYAYPEPVGEQLGKALAASALLGSTIKFEGSLILQIQGDGPISMLVAQCNHERHLRGLARWQGDEITNAPFGDGRMVITIDNQASEERYQGIVGLAGGRINRALEEYFARSEQLQTRLWLAADHDRVVGMLLQHLPGQDADEDVWNRIETLGQRLPTMNCSTCLVSTSSVACFMKRMCACSRSNR